MWLDPVWLSNFTLEELLNSERLSFFPEVTELISSRVRLVKNKQASCERSTLRIDAGLEMLQSGQQAQTWQTTAISYATH